MVTGLKAKRSRTNDPPCGHGTAWVMSRRPPCSAQGDQVAAQLLTGKLEKTPQHLGAESCQQKRGILNHY